MTTCDRRFGAINLEFQPVPADSYGAVNVDSPDGITVSGRLIIDFSVFEPASPGEFLSLADTDPELASLEIKGSGFRFTNPYASNTFTFTTNDFAGIGLRIFSDLDFSQNLLGQQTIGPLDVAPISFLLWFGTYDGCQLSPAEKPCGLSAGKPPPSPVTFPCADDQNMTSFFINPAVTVSNSRTLSNVELINFRLTGAYVEDPAIVPAPAATPSLLNNIVDAKFLKRKWKK